ncbi:hypothetical protein AAFC00_005427 [Neodothiora populina]|uniref:Deacetylase sirtuin-type domain-containing protein n=1 Tax=Neodothiora populina TaxID=2781224 RepID=A0ABR3PKV1_9PEZI
MSEPHVLKHSHTPYKKRDSPEHTSRPSSKHEPGHDAPSATNGHSMSNDARQSREVEKHDEQDIDPESPLSSDDEDISASALEEELDRAEFDPFYEHDVSADDAYPAEEAKALREKLREVGPNRFIHQKITREDVPMRKMVTIFGIRPDLPYSEAWYCRALGLAIQRELRKRYRLPQYNTIDDAVSLLQSCKNIVVITGAGISTSLGIPDFRSKNTGFYSQLLERGFESPEDVFDIQNFDDDPSHFYQLANEILPITDKCSPTHAFIKLLQDKGKLLTNYTQNIDNIEAFAGITPDRLIQCHGSWATATCRKCGYTVSGDVIFADVKAQRVSRCQKCSEMVLQKPRKRKRASQGGSKSRKSSYSDSEDDGQYDIPEAGVMKPNITFFGEKLPNTFFDRLTEHDVSKVDLVVVIGTSMKVAPVSEIPHYISPKVPQIYISREPVDHINFDITLLGYCDSVVAELCKRAGWQLDHLMIPPDFETNVEGTNRPGTWVID